MSAMNDHTHSQVRGTKKLAISCAEVHLIDYIVSDDTKPVRTTYYLKVYINDRSVK